MIAEISVSWFSHRFKLALALVAIGAAAFAHAQIETGQYEPPVGQPGKDVIWLPTAQAVVDKMLDLAQVTAEDVVVDLGSGDGRTVISAAKRGARAVGIEYDPDLVDRSRRNAAAAGVSEKAAFVKADLFEADFSNATVVTMFLGFDLNMKLRPKLFALKPGTRIVSNTFSLGDWEPDAAATVDDASASYWRRAWLWIVPAKVEGTWHLTRGELVLKQKFQTIAGTLRTGKRAVTIDSARLRGDEISFTAANARYTARIVGDAMEGNVRSGGVARKWSAKRRRD